MCTAVTHDDHNCSIAMITTHFSFNWAQNIGEELTSPKGVLPYHLGAYVQTEYWSEHN